MALPASARLYGEATLGYIDYAASNDAGKTHGSSLVQKYALLYNGLGSINYGRSGNYKYTLGYEWATFNSRMTSPDEAKSISDSAGHILFEGDFRFNPPTIPLRIKAYSRDLSRTTFEESSDVGGGFDRMLNPEIVTSLNSGKKITSGLTLMYGLKNPVFDPLYRELPLFSVDVIDQLIKDEKSLSPSDYQHRQVTVALTKGDVEVSLRRTTNRDNRNSNSFESDIWSIGTTSYRGGRRWVDLTNWIALSADASFTRASNVTSWSTSTTNEFDVNLQTIASRETWELMSSSGFTRAGNESSTTSQARVPLFARGAASADTDWQLRTEFRNIVTKALKPEENDKQRDILGSAQLTTLKRSSFTLTPSLSLEALEKNDTSSLVFQGAVESASTRRFSSRYGLYGAYAFAGSLTDSPGSSSQYLQHTITGRGSARVTDGLRIEVEENLVAGSGTNQALTGTLSPQLDQSRQTVIGTTQVDRTTTSFYRSTTRFKLAWIPQPRLTVDFTASGDIYARKDADLDVLMVATNSIRYDLPNFTVGSMLRVSRQQVGSVDNTAYEGNGSVTFVPDANSVTDINYRFFHQTADGAKTTNFDLSQRYKRTFYSVFRRDSLVFTEQLTWYKAQTSSDGFNRTESTKRLVLTADYIPFRNFLISSLIRYSLLEPGRQEILGSFGVGMAFRKFQAKVDYSYGRRNGDDNVVEQKVSAEVKKQF